MRAHLRRVALGVQNPEPGHAARSYQVTICYLACRSNTARKIKLESRNEIASDTLLVQRLVRERREHRAEALVGAFAELAVREDVQVVAADSREHTFAALDGSIQSGEFSRA